jgi:hypothetical protein
MSLSTDILLLLVVFYVGAVLASGRCWLGVWRGSIGFQQLRDLTGIGDRAALRRMFGLTSKDGRYQVTLSAVLRCRRRAGMILTDLPVHAMFLVALAWAAWRPGTPAATAIVVAACAHAILLGAAAASILAASRRPLAE